MNNLLLTKKLIKKAERLHAAQLLAFKKGVFTSHKFSVFEERQKQVLEKLQLWILNEESIVDSR